MQTTYRLFHSTWYVASPGVRGFGSHRSCTWKFWASSLTSWGGNGTPGGSGGREALSPCFAYPSMCVPRPPWPRCVGPPALTKHPLHPTSPQVYFFLSKSCPRGFSHPWGHFVVPLPGAGLTLKQGAASQGQQQAQRRAHPVSICSTLPRCIPPCARALWPPVATTGSQNLGLQKTAVCFPPPHPEVAANTPCPQRLHA